LRSKTCATEITEFIPRLIGVGIGIDHKAQGSLKKNFDTDPDTDPDTEKDVKHV
jgi:hypothetical protein